MSRGHTAAGRGLMDVDGQRSHSLLERVDLILDAFDTDHPSLTLLGIVARTGLPKTTVHRTIHKMMELGWVERYEGRYVIGTRLFERATLAGQRLELRDVAFPFMQELRAVTRETVHLAILVGPEVLLLQRLVGERPPVTLRVVGGRLPALCTALGKALVASRPADVGEEIIAAGLPARTPNSVTSAVQMRQELARIRGEGAGYDRGEFDLSLRCIAAPVVGSDGSAVGAVSVTAPDDRLPFARFAPRVRYAAEQTSHSLAGRLPRWRAAESRRKSRCAEPPAYPAGAASLPLDWHES
jgi:DNA-binding IclR family transcriptional regulator